MNEKKQIDAGSMGYNSGHGPSSKVGGARRAEGVRRGYNPPRLISSELLEVAAGGCEQFQLPWGGGPGKNCPPPYLSGS